MKIKNFECHKSKRNYRKKYLERQTLGRRVVFVLSAQQTTVLYCRLSNFRNFIGTTIGQTIFSNQKCNCDNFVISILCC